MPAETPTTHNFIPVALETLDSTNTQGREFLSELRQRLRVVSGYPQEPRRLFQRLSIWTRYNAVAFGGTFAHLTGADDR